MGVWRRKWFFLYGWANICKKQNSITQLRVKLNLRKLRLTSGLPKNPKQRRQWDEEVCGGALWALSTFLPQWARFQNVKLLLTLKLSNQSIFSKTTIHVFPVVSMQGYTDHYLIAYNSSKDTKLVIGWKLLSLGRPKPKISWLPEKWRHAFFENAKDFFQNNNLKIFSVVWSENYKYLFLVLILRLVKSFFSNYLRNFISSPHLWLFCQVQQD